MLMEMARLSTEDGLVMQLHPGSLRDHNGQIARRFGPDKGADIPSPPSTRATCARCSRPTATTRA
jgi:glucuronate isomerase